VVRGFLRFVGWLLTPLVAWAASFAGATLGALVGGGITSNPMTALWITAGFGGLFAVVGAVVWLRLLRRSPKLQETLALDPDGTPLMALEADPTEKAP
jgi:hypothetical protein